MTPESPTSADAAQIQARFLEGWAHHQKGQLGPAWGIYQEVITRQPKHFDALHLAGIIAAEARHLDQAVELIRRALEIDPNNAAAHYNLGNALADMKQHEAAIGSFDRAIAIDPGNADPYNNRGNALWTLKRFQAAVEGFDKAIALKPNFAEAYNNRGNALRDWKQPQAAVESFDKAIALKPDFAEAYNNRGNALRDLNDFDGAVESYNQAIHFRPDFAEAYNNRGNALKDLKQFQASVNSYDKAAELKPDYADAHFNRGMALRLMKQWQAAIDSYGKAIELKPDYAEAYHSRGLVLAELRQYQPAIDNYDNAIKIKADYAEAYNNRGVALADLKQHEAAVASYDQALDLKTDYAEAYNNRGVSLKELKQLDAALASYDQAILIKADSAEAHNNRGILLGDLRQYAAAIESYDRALLINPAYAFLYGSRLHTKMHICDWRAHNLQVAELLEKVEHGEKAVAPFPILTFTGAPGPHWKAAETWTTEECPANAALGPISRRPRHGKIRVGYFSMDFRNHPVALLVAGLIEAHDRSRFEIYGFSYGPDTQDSMRKRLEGAFDKFFDVRPKSDKDIAALARELEIDIAIDLAGYTNDARTNTFAMRAAPIQVNYLGYPGTMGANYYDYMIADKIVVPQATRHHYVEKIAYLPNSYQANDRSRVVIDEAPFRERFGLPAAGFVFCCFNNNFKIAPNTFAIWMRILQRVEGSVLWLFEDNPAAAANLRLEAERTGVTAQRLIFATRAPHGEHMARHRAADLFLDTLPYNAHTTASDALWAGLPVLTCMGESFAGRVAASVLSALDLPELITATAEDYEAQAVTLATNPELLERLKQRIAANRLTTPLFDAKLYAGHIEDAFARMFERYHAGLAPEDIYVGS